MHLRRHPPDPSLLSYYREPLFNATNQTNATNVCTSDCLSEVEMDIQDELQHFANAWCVCARVCSYERIVIILTKLATIRRCVSGQLAFGLVVVLEHFVIVLKIILTCCIPDMPAWVHDSVRIICLFLQQLTGLPTGAMPWSPSYQDPCH